MGGLKNATRFARGTKYFVDVMSLISRRACHGQDIADALGVPRQGAWNSLGLLHRAGIAYVHVWVICGRRWVPKLRLGRRKDAPVPVETKRPGKIGGNVRRASQFASLAAIWQFISLGPKTRQQIEQDSGLVRHEVYHVLKLLKKAGLVHIAGWERRIGMGGEPRPMYSAGPGVDAPRIARLKSEELVKRNRISQRAKNGGARQVSKALLDRQSALAKAPKLQAIDSPNQPGWQERQPIRRIVAIEQAQKLGEIPINSVFALGAA